MNQPSLAQQIAEQVVSIQQSQIPKKPEKPYQLKMPFRVKTKFRKLAKNNSAIAMILQRNNDVFPKIGEFTPEGILKIEEKDYTLYKDGHPMSVFRYMGKHPMVIIPEWNIRPIGTYDYEQATKNGLISDSQQTTIKALMATEPELGKKKKSIPPIAIIGAIIAIGVIAYIFLGGG